MSREESVLQVWGRGVKPVCVRVHLYQRPGTAAVLILAGIRKQVIVLQIGEVKNDVAAI